MCESKTGVKEGPDFVKTHFLGLASQTWWASSSNCMTLISRVSLPKMLVNVGKVLKQISHMLIVIQPLLICMTSLHYYVITLIMWPA